MKKAESTKRQAHRYERMPRVAFRNAFPLREAAALGALLIAIALVLLWALSR